MDEIIDIIEYPSRTEWLQLLKRPVSDAEEIESKVVAILKDVKASGDSALIDFTKKFDGVDLNDFRVSIEDLEKAESQLTDDLKSAITVAKSNIEKFHLSQKEVFQKIETTEGVVCWRRSVAIDTVGLYIPGGTAPLFSTVLMLGIPALIAGCRNIIICTPASKDGTVHPAILYTANLIGIHNIFKVGGAQAIAAMAYGTETIPKVNKIFGPGNAFVTAAKKIVSMEDVAIDLPAGPSEVAILADDSCNPSYVASEILSQCEHGKNSQAVLICTSKKIVSEVLIQLSVQIDRTLRKKFILQGLSNSKIIQVKDIREAIELVNEYAPEHLVIQTEEDDAVALEIVNAGSVFIGEYSPVAAGDYGSGTNHTLPTGGYAKSYSGVSLDSFVKKITFQKITQQGLNNIGKSISVMAEAEGLDAHKNSITMRMSN